MSVLVLALGMSAPVPLCLLRRRRYGLSYLKLLLIFLVVSASGGIGAALGGWAGGGDLTGKRLYGLMLMDTVTLLCTHRLFGLSIAQMGDFIAAPVILSCASAKIDCILQDCCYGLVLKPLPEAGRAIRFPSAVVELCVWAVLALVLLLLERKKKLKGLMWPLATIAFGILRFIVDFFRGSASDKRPFCPGITMGQFWSLVCLAVGVVFLVFMIVRKKKEQEA